MGRCVVHPITDHGTPAVVEANKAAFDKHVADAVRHITAAERVGWNQKPYVCGVYTGDGAEFMDVYLGFQPAFVSTWSSTGAQLGDRYPFGGAALPGRPCVQWAESRWPTVSVTSTGFRVSFIGGTWPSYSNTKDGIYYYIAFR